MVLKELIAKVETVGTLSLNWSHYMFEERVLIFNRKCTLWYNYVIVGVGKIS